MVFLVGGQWQVGLFFMWSVISWPVLLRGQWQVSLFCYVVSNKLACFVTWSVISWAILLRGQ